MTTIAQNELLTRTGPGTSMGALFRRYWIPVMMSSEVAGPDCDPVRVKLLSEELICFRDTAGTVALLDRYCPHRRVSLWFGRNEGHGLRCSYHGWKFDAEGQCVDIPSHEGDDALRKDIRIKSYPCIERGGVVWTYMGPPEHRPPPPEFEWTTVPGSHRYVDRRLGECNYLQALEGGIDSSHVSSLHGGELRKGGTLDSDPGTGSRERLSFLNEKKIHFEVTPSASGLQIGASRRAGDGTNYWRITQWIMPWYTMIPPRTTDSPLHGHAWVPIDDENCFVWNVTYHPSRPLTETELEEMHNGEGIYAELIPGSFRTAANKDNDYLMDREAQREGRYYSGIKGIAMQDASVQESMGPIVDRSLERLTTTDIAIVQTRRRLMEAARRAERGEELPALDPSTYRVRSATLFLPEGVRLADAEATLQEATRTESPYGERSFA
ncbi:Phthalate 4,5-dioxygenase oxygenase subunit [Pigmentiphaga humi]|uniref:Phthalate 4,5-dioxygenase oxygenase subunit n=1 Tax=Pigmentiphaga humi TaxID=2478468 RepID=A0A3P4B8E8_9BURK|nr:Rieske 2Fe-2S domain-containing protein [Pigmentiphaga humi]VCU71796.1 Phthalate 4,5-dioxygenase oxygenase subunit [Pigmentiphaga humi]